MTDTTVRQTGDTLIVRDARVFDAVRRDFGVRVVARLIGRRRSDRFDWIYRPRPARSASSQARIESKSGR